MIKVQNIYKSFGRDSILEDINLTVNNRETVTIIGPSGCGKSTLLRLLTGLELPDSGQIYVNDLLLNKPNLYTIRSNIGFVFQYAALFDSMSVFDNVAFPLRERLGLAERLIEKTVMEKLEWVDLREAVDQLPRELSGGMKKRVSLARALASEPRIIFYDEPTTGLDPLASLNIERLIVKLQKDLDLTSIVVTHQFSTIDRVSDRIVMIKNNKRLIDLGPKQDAYHSKDQEARDFFEACKVYVQ